MKTFKSFLQLSWLQKILFAIAFTMLIIYFYQMAQWPIFKGLIINPEKPQYSITVYVNDVEIKKVDTIYKLPISKEFFNVKSFDSVTLNYSYGKPYITINYKNSDEYLFSKLWWWKILGQMRAFSEVIIFLILLFIVLEVKRDKTFNQKVVKNLIIIATLLILHPIIYTLNYFILESFLRDNFYGKFNDLGVYSKAMHFFYPLFLALVVVVLIDVFRKGKNIEAENDLTI